MIVGYSRMCVSLTLVTYPTETLGSATKPSVTTATYFQREYPFVTEDASEGRDLLCLFNETSGSHVGMLCLINRDSILKRICFPFSCFRGEYATTANARTATIGERKGTRAGWLRSEYLLFWSWVSRSLDMFRVLVDCSWVNHKFTIDQ